MLRLSTSRRGVFVSDRILQCVCGVTVAELGNERFDWITGDPHFCYPMTDWLELVTEAALDGDDDAAYILPSVVDAWLQ